MARAGSPTVLTAFRTTRWEITISSHGDHIAAIELVIFTNSVTAEGYVDVAFFEYQIDH